MVSGFTSVLLTLWIEPISCSVFPEIEFQYLWASIVTPFCRLILSQLSVREFKFVFPPSRSNKRMFSLRFSYWMICSSMFWILVSSFYCDLRKRRSFVLPFGMGTTCKRAMENKCMTAIFTDNSPQSILCLFLLCLYYFYLKYLNPHDSHPV